jgi:SAM-dependent methyltransferase
LVPGNFHGLEVDAAAFDVVVLGHVCRTEGDEGGRALVAAAMRALKPGGQLLLADYFADAERKYNAFGVQMGLTMMANTVHGGVLTNAQVAGWLDDVGFRSIRLLEPIGFTFVYVASKPLEVRPERLGR